MALSPVLLDLFSTFAQNQAAEAESRRVESELSEIRRQADAAQAQADAAEKQAKEAIQEAREDARQAIGTTSIESERGMRILYNDLKQCRERAKRLEADNRTLKARVTAFAARLRDFESVFR
jgi:chromosome segregation ATPase